MSIAELMALATGEIVVAYVERGALTEGDEIDLVPSGGRPEAEVKPAYRRWLHVGPPVGYTAVVVSVDPAALLDPHAGSARHVLAAPGEGDLVLLRVFDDTGPVLSDEAFAARKRSVEGALQA